MSDSNGSAPVVGLIASLVVCSAAGVFALSTRWETDGELEAAYAEADHHSVHAGIAEERREVAERAVEIKRAYYLEREVLSPWEQALIRVGDQLQAAEEAARAKREVAQKAADKRQRKLDRLQKKIDRILFRAKQAAQVRDNLTAIKLVNDALALNPKLPGALHMRAVLHLRENDPDAAIGDCDEAIALEPDLVEAYVTRGSALRAKGDPNGAIADYTRALKKDPNDVEALNNRGFVLVKQGRNAEAVRDYTRALRRDPTSVETYVNRAQARIRLGDKKGAAGDFDRALKLLRRAGKGHTGTARAIERRRARL